MAQQFYVKINNFVHGPLTGQKLQEMAQSGQLSPTDEVRLTNSQTLHPAGNIKGLQFALAPGEEDSQQTAGSADWASINIIPLAPVEEEPQQTAPPSAPDQEEAFSDLQVSIPKPPDYPAVSFIIGLYNFFGWLIILLAAIAFLISTAISIKQGDISIVLLSGLVVIAYLFLAALSFFGAQLLKLATDSARNLHYLTHFNRRIMESIVNNKK